MLLHFLKESGSSALSTGSPNKSPSRPSQIVYDSARLSVPLQLSMSDQGVSSGERINPLQARGILSVKNTHTDTVDHSAVDDDVLADSDDEEMKEKDLDWHLGRLTSRQSVLSQWSQTLSSTAAHYSSKNKKVASNGPSQRIEKPRDPHVSTTGQNGQRHRTVDPVQSLHKSDGRESLRIFDGHRPGPVEDTCGSGIGSSSSSSSSSGRGNRSNSVIDKDKCRTGVRNSSYVDCHPAHSDDNLLRTADKELVSKTPSVAPKVVDGLTSLVASSTYGYAENDFSFGNFSNMTNILESAKVILDENALKYAQYGGVIPPHNLELLGGSMESIGGVPSHLLSDDITVRAEIGVASTKSGSKGLFATIMQDSHVQAAPDSHRSNTSM